MKEYLSWVTLMTKIPVKARYEWLAQVIKGLKSYRGKSDKRRQWLSDMIMDSGEFETVGFAANTSYVKIDGNAKELNCMFVHPWGSPTLLLKHKRLPLCVLVSASMRYDETILNENGGQNKQVRGLTG